MSLETAIKGLRKAVRHIEVAESTQGAGTLGNTPFSKTIMADELEQAISEARTAVGAIEAARLLAMRNSS